MSLSILIRYNNPDRELFVKPVSFESVLIHYWWPLAQELQLEYVSMFEVLRVTELEDVQQLLGELDILENYLDKSDAEVPENTKEYMLRRIGELKSYLTSAINEWDEIDYISI